MSAFEMSEAHRAHLDRQREQRSEQGEREAARRRRIREQQRARAGFVDGTLLTPEQLAAAERQRREDFHARQGLPVPDAGRGSSPTSAAPSAVAVESPAPPGEESRRAPDAVTPHRASSSIAWLSRPPAGSPCARCGEPTPPPKPQGRPRVFCSTVCSNRAHAARSRAKRKAAMA